MSLQMRLNPSEQELIEQIYNAYVTLSTIKYEEFTLYQTIIITRETNRVSS